MANTAGGGASAGFGGASTPGSVSGIGSSDPGVSATGADTTGDTGLGSGWGGFWGGLTNRGKFSAQDQAFLGRTSYGRGLQAGHALGLVGSLAMSFTNPNPISFAKTAFDMYGHATALGQLSGSRGGLTGPPGAQPADGPDPRPSRSFKAKRKKAPAPAPAPAPKATPYTETKEYLGGQKRIRGLQGEIAKLGAELEAIREKRKALEPEPRKMVGRIPLVHTELESPKEAKALSPEKRKRMLMSHSVPEGAGRRASG